MNYQIEERAPSPEEYCQLRIRAGLSPKPHSTAAMGLPNSLYAISLRDEGALIGMGRVVGDGACFFQIVDVAVDPRYQGLGLGKVIMDKIEEYLCSVARGGAFVSLIGDKPEFYEKLGYRHTAPGGYGMYKRF